ncbi:MAG: GYD domain-containing protein [Longimicrobiales bacterium]|nr:GYD domain-containing protein [Longimicrobiales bacterium]
MKVLAAYFTVGPYDLVVISEANDEKAASAFTLAIGAQGNIRSITMRAWDPGEFGEIVAMMP